MKGNVIMRVNKHKGWRLILFSLAIVCFLSFALYAALIDNGTTSFNEQWQGNPLEGYINWWVYDDHSDFDNASFDVPETGEYIYVYQINTNLQSAHEVAFFSILGLDENNVSGQAIGEDASGIQSVNDGYLDPTDGAAWNWTENAYGYVGQDERSWYLILTSEYAPVVRDFKIEGPAADDPLKAPGDGEVPEPLTVALLSLGGAALIRRRKR